MLNKTSRKDVAKDKASELVSAAADAAEAGRDKIAPVAENVTGHLSDAAESAADAAAPHLARAKETIADAATPHVEKAKKAKKQTKKAAKQAAKEATKKPGKKATKQAKQQAKGSATETVGLTAEQARRLFQEEWLPRVHDAIAAAGATGGSAYAALPQQARDAVEVVAPEVVKKRRKKGKLLISLGLLAGAGAVALYVGGQQKDGSKSAPTAAAPEVERLDVSAAEGPAVPASDDAVGDLEKKADATVSGSRRGRHAAQD